MRSHSSAIKRITTAIFSFTLAAVMALSLTGCSLNIEQSQDTNEEVKTEQTEQTSDSQSADGTLEAEDEAVKLLSRYLTVCSEYINTKEKFLGDAEWLFGFIGAFSSVDYGDYPVVKPVEITGEKATEIIEKAGFSNGDSVGALIEYDAKSVRWISENIFNMKPETFDTWAEVFIVTSSSVENGEFGYYGAFSAKGSDGLEKYYTRADSDGILDRTVDITLVKKDGGKFLVKFDVCDDTYRTREYEYLQNIEVYDDSFYATGYAVMERKEIDGKKYWTLYEISRNIPEGIFSESSADAYQDIKGNYMSENTYSELDIDENGKCSGNFFHTALDGVHDYQLSQYDITFSTPEKIDKYTYRAKINKLEYKNKVGSEKDEDGIKTVYVEAWDLKEGNYVYFYIKGTPIIKAVTECHGYFRYQGNSNDCVLGSNCIYIPELTCYYITE